jgi:hypothetical protein
MTPKIVLLLPASFYKVNVKSPNLSKSQNIKKSTIARAVFALYRVAYLCENFACKARVVDPKALIQLLTK